MRRIVLLFLCFVSFEVFAQDFAKKSLSIDDFGNWNTLSNSIISNDGTRIAFEQNPQKGDGMLIVKSGKSDYDTIPRGNKAAFGPENNFIVFSIKQPEDSIRKAKLDKVKKEDMPKDSLGIWVFGRNEINKFPKLKSFKIPEENARWIAFTVEPAPAPKDTTENNSKKKKEKQEGDDLVLFQVETGDTLMVRNIKDWHYAKKGGALFFSREVKDSTGTVSSLYEFKTSNGDISQVFSDEGWMKKLTSDEAGHQFTFLFSQDTIKEKVYSLFLGSLDETPETIVDGYTSGIPVGWTPSENGNIYFSEDGTKLFFGTAEAPEPAAKDTILDEEKPKLDIWHWQDLKLQPQQKVEADREKKRTYMAVYHINLNRFIQLADPQVRDISTLQKGNSDLAFGYNELPYLRESSWTGDRKRDYYIVDVKSGIKREIADCKSYVRISPQGKYVVWYEPADSSFYARSTDINQLEAVSLTKILPVNFYDERNDTPMDPRPYGVAGWSDDDRFVYIYDRYDIWKLDPAGERVPVNITKAFGRRNQTRLRYINLDPDLEHIPTDEQVLLSAFDERTMSGGFFRTRFGVVADPEMLAMEKNHLAELKRRKMQKS
jgi:hypothetical protein